MLPTLRSQGDWVVHDRISHRLTARASLTRGTLVIYNAPYDRTRVVCKRLIGLPGDIICVDPYPDPPLDGDGEQIEDDVMRREGAIESDVISRLVKPNSPRHIVVPEGHFWAQGDNRPWTRDSNNYGPVPFGLLRGQARAIISVCVAYCALTYLIVILISSCACL